jgi:hypothetical protein
VERFEEKWILAVVEVVLGRLGLGITSTVKFTELFVLLNQAKSAIMVKLHS